MFKSPSGGVFSSNTIFMFDGTNTAAPATGLLPPQVARSDHNITVLGALATTLPALACRVASTTGSLLGLELISTGPLDPAVTAPDEPRTLMLAAPALPDSASELITGVVELLPLPALVPAPAPPPPPPQAARNIERPTAIIDKCLQIFLININ